MPPKLRGWFEIWDSDLLVGLDEGDLHWHSYLHLVGVALDDVGKHLDTFVQFHQCQHVWKVFFKTKSSVLAGYGKGPNSSFACGSHPSDILAPAVGTYTPGIELVLLATATFLNDQVSAPAGVPKRFSLS